MKNIPFSIIFTLFFALFGTNINAQTENKPLKTFHDFTVKTIDGIDENGNLIGTLAPNVGDEIQTIIQWLK